MEFTLSAYSPFTLCSMNFNTIFHLGVSGLTICALAWLWMKTFRRPLDRRISVFRFPPWSFHGTLHLMPSSWTMRQMSLGFNVYLLQFAHGMSIIHKDKDVFGVWMAFKPFVILRKTQVIEALLSDSTIIEKAWSYNMLHPWLGKGLLTSGGHKWRSRRKLLTHSFHFDILKDFQPIFDEQSKVFVEILKSQCHKDWVDIVQYITLCSLDIICESILGVKIGAQRNSNLEYVQSVKRATDLLMERVCTPLYWIDFIYNMVPAGRQFNREIKVLHQFSRKVIREKKSAMKQQNGSVGKDSNSCLSIRKRQALMDLLLDIHLGNQELTEEDIREEIDTFTFEGHDTTSIGISWVLYLLGLYPDVQAKVHEELDYIFGEDTEREVTMEDLKQMNYLECVLKESQRLYPSVPLFGRQIEVDGKLYGYDLKKGTVVMILSYVFHHDPDIYPDPEKFDPSRFFPENCLGRHAYAYIPFSAGPRNCIGQRFAMMEEKTVVAHVLRNFSLRSIDPRDRICLSSEIVLRPFHPLKIKISPRVFSDD